METIKIIRCVNLDTNKVKYFPSNICYNDWWQKNTRFIPQEIEPTTINSNSTSESVSEFTENNVEDLDIETDSTEKPKRKYTKRKKQDGSNPTE